MSVNDITYISRKYDRNLKKITQPLLDQFGITLFGISEVSNDGFWSAISNNAHFFDYNVSHNFHKHDPILIDPNYYKSGISYIESHHYEGDGNSILEESKKLFDINHSLIIFDKNPNGCQFYYFATQKNNSNIINTYLSKRSLLRKFIHQFKDDHKKMILETKEYKVDIRNIRSSHYFNDSNMYDISPDNEPMVTVNTDICLSNLTSRERECLHHYLKGRTAKDTAKILNLSPRTIEDYITALKVKFDCENKRDLLRLFTREFI